jgi:phosphatidate phosphatase PAH1
MRYLLPWLIFLTLGGCSAIPSVVPTPEAQLSKVVITDIDGTLTPKNIRIFTARPGAAEALTAFSKKGYQIVYLSARHPLVQIGLQDFLDKNGFPVGALHVPQTTKENEDAEKFKFSILAQYLSAGWQLEYAYGDADTDFIAYAKANVPTEHIFALKRKGSDSCDAGAYQQCLDGWSEHMPYVDRFVPSLK